MHRPPLFGKWPLWKYLGGVVLGSLVVTGGFLWLRNPQTGGITAQHALIAGLLFIAVALGNLLVGVGYLEALQFTTSRLEDDELLK